MKSNQQELLPCPFCGGKASPVQDYVGENGILCETCFAYVPEDSNVPEDCVATAAAKWNRRQIQLYENQG